MQVKKLLRRILILFVLIGLVYGIWYNSVSIAPHQFKIETIDFSDQRIPEAFNGFKIGFISDFDLKTSDDLTHLESCIEKLNKQNCDMVIFGGDLFENGTVFDEDKMISLLKNIQAPYGKLAVLGETEFLKDLEKSIEVLEKGGFEVMRNEAHPIYYKNASIIYAGLETSGDVDSLLTDNQKSQFILCAVHQPDYFTDLSNSSAAVVLSGHSGGGYIYLPLFGSLSKIDGAETYVHGHYTVNDHHLYISNGIGMGHEKKARFNCKPNALVIELNHAVEKTLETPTPNENTDSQ